MIREMKENEIDECVLLISSSFMTVANEYGFTKENAPRFTAFATTPERLRYHRDIEKRPMYVYVSDTGKIIGYYSLALLDEGICELNNLCVDPDKRHNAIGEKLLSHAFRRAKELGCVTAAANVHSQNIALKAGFRPAWVETEAIKIDEK